MRRDGCEHMVILTLSTSFLDTPTFPHLLLGSPGTWWNLAPQTRSLLCPRGSLSSQLKENCHTHASIFLPESQGLQWK